MKLMKSLLQGLLASTFVAGLVFPPVRPVLRHVLSDRQVFATQTRLNLLLFMALLGPNYVAAKHVLRAFLWLLWRCLGLMQISVSYMVFKTQSETSAPTVGLVHESVVEFNNKFGPSEQSAAATSSPPDFTPSSEIHLVLWLLLEMAVNI